MPDLTHTRFGYRALIMLIATLLAAAGCERKEFVLPPGDKAAGKQAFTELKCNSCHSVTDQIEHAPLTPGAIHVELGGTVSRVKTYDDLVTSIINPSHRLSRGTNLMTTTPEGQSRMPVYNEVMSVQQLIDITSFLEPTYQVWVPPYAVYQYP
jgi:predicted small lipoprotein YifL